jgi:hypothetical protein
LEVKTGVCVLDLVSTLLIVIAVLTIGFGEVKESVQVSKANDKKVKNIIE